MTEQTSKQRDRRRYSGPELAPLLDEVMAVHGPAAPISAVNKVRSGGVAGFFCREEYEVVLDPTPDTSASADHELTEDELTEDELTEYERVGPLVSGHEPDDDEPVAGASAGRDRRAVAASGEGTDFRSLLEQHLNATEPLAGEVVGQPASTRPTVATPAAAPSTATTSVLPVPGTEPRASEGAELEQRSRPSRFWMRLYRVRRELENRLPGPAPVTAVVGPLAMTMPVIRNLQCQHGLAGNDVVLLTPRADVVSEPSWQLVRTGQQMMEAADLRRAAVLAIDVDIDLPVWVEPLLERLRSSGLGLTRYLLAELQQIEILLNHRGADGGTYAIDFASRIEPAELVSLIERDLPIATVGGAEVNAELLVAMRGLASAE